MPELTEITSQVKDYIITEFLYGEDSGELTETTPLITGGILDSVATMKLVTHLEDTYDIEIPAHETVNENFDTLAAISQLVHTKLN